MFFSAAVADALCTAGSHVSGQEQVLGVRLLALHLSTITKRETLTHPMRGVSPPRVGRKEAAVFFTCIFPTFAGKLPGK